MLGKVFSAAILACILLLQYELWLGESGIPRLINLEQHIEKLTIENKQLRVRNELVMKEVEDLRGGLDAIEERARNELGMIKEGEVFFKIVDKKVSK